jgi:hypothetical protein
MWDFFIYFLFSKNSGDRVNSTRVKRITPHHPLDCHPSTLYSTIFVNSLVTVMGTGWIKSAGVSRDNG